MFSHESSCIVGLNSYRMKPVVVWCCSNGAEMWCNRLISADWLQHFWTLVLSANMYSTHCAPQTTLNESCGISKRCKMERGLNFIQPVCLWTRWWRVEPKHVISVRALGQGNKYIPNVIWWMWHFSWTHFVRNPLQQSPTARPSHVIELLVM